MTTSTTACPQGITAEQIAALRDDALDAAEAERLRAHIATCPTCQTTQTAYDEVARTLTAQRIPTPDARLWREVQARLSQSPRRALPIAPRAVWGSAGALASVIVLAVLFAQVFGHLSGTSTSYHSTTPQSTQTASITPAPTITPTALPALKVQWQTQDIASANSWAVSPADGDIGYGCELNATGSAITIWRVQRGQTAQTVATLAGPGADNGTCAIVPDNNQAHIVVVRIFGSNGHGPAAMEAFTPHAAPGTGPELQDDVSFDGGVSWHVVPNGIEINELATVANLTYATIGTAQAPTPLLAVSRDGMATWQRLHAPNDTPHAAVIASEYGLLRNAHTPQASGYGLQIWVSPDGNTVYYLNNIYQVGYALYVSHNGGTTWGAVALPSNTISNIVAAPPTSATHWRICAKDFTDFSVWCSANGGTTWQQQPTPPAAIQQFYFGGIAANGDVIMGSQVQIGQTSQYATTAYRLTPGATQWQSLGSAPSVPNVYPVSGGKSVLWAEGGSLNPAFPAFYYTATYP